MMQEYLKAGRQAVRWIYVLISGLAIKKAIEILFQTNVSFQIPSADAVLLFIVFFSFISRFLLGAYRVLSYDIEIEVKRAKVIIDALTLFVQALVFYVFSLGFNDLQISQWIIVAICGWELFWLVLLWVCFGIIEKTTRVWVIHDFAVIGAVLLNLFFFNSLGVLVILATVAAATNFWINADFFFSFKQSHHLRIFVAGPYGDYDTEETRAKNVEAARDIGKELALRGHFPFIPHTMLHGWELDQRFGLQQFKEIDFAWLEFCDALYFIAESPGANVERDLALHRGLQVFTDLGQVPDARLKKTPKF
jgi:hypothetical protein